MNIRKTSVEAHERMKPHKDTHYNTILKVLSRIGEGTSVDIAALCDLDSVAVNRRLGEMEKIGMIEVSGRTDTHLKWSKKGYKLSNEEYEKKREYMNTFFKAVKDMRKAQKLYALTYIKIHKQIAKELEKSVDDLIQEMINPNVEQKELFK